MIGRVLCVILTLVVLAGYRPVNSQSVQSLNDFDLVDQTGNIRKPADDRFQVLGTYAVLDPKGNEMHVTYASPGAAEYYRKNGSLPMARCW